MKLPPVLIAIAILILVVVSYLFFTKSSAETEWRMVKVEKGTTATVRLNDNSLIELNAGTTLRYPETFNKRKREVYVEGEAFIKATPNPDQPLLVHTREATVTVLGTSFNVSSYEGKFSAALVSGAILVTTAGGQTVKLTPGYSASLLPKKDQLVVSTFKEKERTGWIEGKYLFEYEALADICKVIERVYNVKIVYDTKPSPKHFSGAMNRNEPVHVILNRMSVTSGTGYYVDKNGIIHWK